MGPNFHLEQTPDAKNAYSGYSKVYTMISSKEIHARNSNQDKKNSTNQSHREQKNIKRKKA
jgi:hypothetical protein